MAITDKLGRRGRRRRRGHRAGSRLEIYWHGELIVDVPPRSVAHDGPVYERPCDPAGVPRRAAGRRRRTGLPRPATGEELRDTLLRLVASPNLCDKSWVTDQYDRYVMGNTALAQPDDAGVVRVDEETGLGVAISTDCNGRFAKLDPYAGAQLALAEAYRNVATAGAVPLAVTDCLNFGSPEDPGVMWQFAEAIRGLSRRLPRARHPGHRRQRVASTTRPATSRSTRPPWSACSASSTTSPAARRRAGRRRAR